MWTYMTPRIRSLFQTLRGVLRTSTMSRTWRILSEMILHPLRALHHVDVDDIQLLTIPLSVMSRDG
jgi:hypothetical protein